MPRKQNVVKRPAALGTAGLVAEVVQEAATVEREVIRGCCVWSYLGLVLVLVAHLVHQLHLS